MPWWTPLASQLVGRGSLAQRSLRAVFWRRLRSLGVHWNSGGRRRPHASTGRLLAVLRWQMKLSGLHLGRSE
eukprot:1016265-Amphidinium_carterae.1